MGNESKREILEISSVKALTETIKESLVAIDNAIAIAESLGITEIPIRQIPKGKKAIEGLMDFTNLMKKSVLELVLTEKRVGKPGGMAAEPKADYEKPKGSKLPKKPES